ncbi:MAG: V-type ATP synthase subunit I [Methanosarcinaceae archaeon]|nr:V-type ATP synthase subunit I [Methanosarcinaceae archaeon]
MLSPKQMSRVTIVGHKTIMEQTVNALHGINSFHIEDYNDEELGLKIGKSFENADDVSNKLIKIRSISSFLGIKNTDVGKQNVESLFKELDTKLVELDDEVSKRTDRKNEIENHLKELDTLNKELQPFITIPLDLDQYSGYENLAVFSGVVKGDIEFKLSSITKSYELFSDARSGTMVLFVLKEHADAVSDILPEFAFKELRVPEISGLPADLLKKMGEDIVNSQNDIQSLNAEIESLRLKYSDFILASDELLSIEAQKSEVPLRVATSEHTFMMDGWVPNEDYDMLARTVEDATNGRAFISRTAVTREEDSIVPIKYDNPKISRPFEEIMNLYSRPRYSEIDPTSLIFITFPLFYGMILGDIGYALILMGLALGIKKLVKSDAVKPLMNILIYCQISTLIFGVLYGEFLGFPLASLHTEHGIVAGLIPGFETINLFASPFATEMITYPVHRTHLVMTMIVVTALIGVVHINIGYLLGFVNERRKHGIVAAMLEKGSWLVIELGILLLALGYAGYIPSAVGIAVFLIGFVMLLKGEGIKGPIELPALLSNSLSYTRIIAVGLSSIYIASTVNQIAFEMVMPKSFGLMTIFAILIFLFGHALNTVLSIIAPGLHALRLQYVEFFTKFYEGGGIKYNPFGYIRKYTEE